MFLYLCVALGGAVGTIGRFALNGFVSNLFGATFPWGTLILNVVGSFAIGFFAALTDPSEGRVLVGGTGRQFFMTGICGGFTTFSSFSLQTLNLARDGEWARAGGNVVGSVVLCLLAVWIGYTAAMALNLKKGTVS
jgi:fluoride exporter